jgi:ATP-dependent DNA helicase DinG
MTDLKVIQGPWEGSSPPGPPGDYINDVFGNEGYLSKNIPNYQERPSQIALARSIDEAIRTRKHVIAEGPTGTGKSLAYAVPAAYHAVHSGRRFCIVTSNKTLQQQIYSKDLKALREAVPWNFTYAIRKGIGSYLCERDLRSGKYERLLREVQLGEGPENKEMEEMIHATLDWAKTTKDGDSETITGMAPNRRVWSQFSTDRDACDGKHCSAIADCHSRKAREAAEGVHIIVTNYWMFYLHVRNSTKDQPSPILPEFDVAIMDEAHNASEIARGFWGLELSKWSIRKAIASLRQPDFAEFQKEGDKLWDKCWTEIDRVWDYANKRYKEGDIRLRFREELKTKVLERHLDDAARFYRKVGKVWEPDADRKDHDAKIARAKAGRLFKRANKVADLQNKLELFRTMPMLEEDRWKRQVYYMEKEDSDDVKLLSKSLFVGAHLRHQLFDVYPTVVQTSATLAINGRSRSQFTHLKEEMGMLGLDNLELTVDSPFKWESQCMLVVPDESVIPSYSKNFDDWQAQLGAVVERIIRMVNGRTMVLFTSLKRMNAVKEHLAGVKLPFNVYTQGELSPGELQRKFKSEINSVLLGSKRFSEGIDVQGEACTCVIIDKLPFGQPNDPVLQAIGDMRAQEEGVTKEEGGKLAFMEHSVPEAIISFKQRMGRLIRTVSDCGVVIVLDDRLKTRSYGYRFMRSIPKVRQTRKLEDITPFLRGLGLL